MKQKKLEKIDAKNTVGYWGDDVNEIVDCINSLIDVYNALEKRVDRLDEDLGSHVTNETIDKSWKPESAVCECDEPKPRTGAFKGLCFNCGKPLPPSEDIREKIFTMLCEQLNEDIAGGLADDIVEIVKGGV